MPAQRRRLQADAVALVSAPSTPQRFSAPLSAAALLVAAFLGGLAPAASLADVPLPPVALQCQLDGGPWRDCLMRIESIGQRWSLEVGREQLWFEHDGRGLVRMRRRDRWVPVEPHWSADAALCWDGICAKGEIPLD
jgi:hypothetical protein